MLSHKRLLILAPHADDEVLGCGGLLSALRRRKDPPAVRAVLLSNGAVDLNHGTGETRLVEAGVREREFRAVCSLLGAEAVVRAFQTRSLHLFHSDLVKAVEDQAAEFEPDCLLLPYKSFHPDHTAVYDAALAALRPNHCRSVRTVLAYETFAYAWSAEDDRFLPNLYADLDPRDASDKLALCAVYSSQRLDQPFARAAVVGHLHRRGLEAHPVPADPAGPAPCAEAFRLLRAYV